MAHRLQPGSTFGTKLGNHTFSHLGFKDATLAQYEDDFVRGESVTKMLLKEKGATPRYFRHPYLQMGKTFELESAFDKFIGERGYRIAPVTVDTLDWMFLAAYAKSLSDHDLAMQKKVSEDYLSYAGQKFDTCRKEAIDLFGHQIKHILLLHANELNADNFDKLATLMESKGFRFITLEQALADPVYQFPEKYTGTSDWLAIWAISKGVRFDSPSPPDYIQKAYANPSK